MKDKYLELVKENKWILLILLVSTFLRFYHLDYQSLWMDEIYTLNISSPKLSFSEFHSELMLRDGFPHLYFILLKIGYFIFGYSSFVARGLSAIAGIISVYIIYLLGKELISKSMGLFAATLLTINEYNIYISQDARPYTLYFLTVVLSFYCLVKLLKENTLKNAIVYGISAGLILNVNFFGFINILSQVIIIAFYFLLMDKESKVKVFKNYIISGIVALLLFIPNYQMFLKLFKLGTFWVPRPTNDSLSIILKDFLGNSELILFIVFPIFFYYLFKIFNENEKFSLENLKNNKLLFSFTILFGWAFVFIAYITIKSYGDVSFMLSRYFTSVTPVIFLVLGSGIYFIKNKLTKTIVLISIVTLTFMNLIVVKGYYKALDKAQFRETSKFVIENNKKNEVVYTSQKYWFDYYYQDSKTDLQEIEFEALIQSMIQDPSKIKPFWFVDAFGKTYAPSEASQNFINTNFYIENNYDGFQAWNKHFILLKDVPKTIDISKFKNLQQYNGDPFMLNVETFENVKNIVKTTGWAYFDKQESSKSIVDIVFIKDGVAQRLLTQKVVRPDVTTYFKCDFDASNSGFSSTMDVSMFPAGKYQLAVHLINLETKKEGLVLIDKFVEK